MNGTNTGDKNYNHTVKLRHKFNKTLLQKLKSNEEDGYRNDNNVKFNF